LGFVKACSDGSMMVSCNFGGGGRFSVVAILGFTVVVGLWWWRVVGVWLTS